MVEKYKYYPNGIFSISKSELQFQQSKDNEIIDDADFETAISNSKFGVFNYMLLFVSFFVALAPGFETTTMSYVGPASGCDLKINLNQKGLLNASTYIGMISSAFLWGYLSDILGRKKLLIYGLLMTILSDTLGSFSQNYIFLLTCRFLSGFAVCGPYAVLVTYLSELHSAKYRSKIIILFGAYISISNLILPFIAWWIIPKDIKITVFNYFTLHSWNIFMIITPVPALISALAMLFFPESPKFLMSKGNNAKALAIFQTVFAKNTKLTKNMYPVKSLIDELSKRNLDNMQNSKSGSSTHLKSLCFAPYISNLALILTIQFFTMLGANTLRLWLPQLFTAFDMHDTKNSNVSVNICSIIDDLAQKDIKNTTCSRVDDHMNGIVFKNSIIVAFCSAVGYLITVVIVNKFDKKNLMIFLFVCSALSGYGNYCSTSITTTLLFSSIYVTFTAICSTVILSFVVDLFPTYLRAMTVSLAMMSGRTGVIVGNFLFPLLLQTGCFPPFFMISFILIICAVLTFLLPATNMKSLQ